MGFVNWMFDSLASEDVIDLYFILSDLVDINITPAERAQSNYYDSLAMQTIAEAAHHEQQSKIPLGKRVY